MNIRINTKSKLNTISPLLIGAFFEDINYGGDGGLYAELVSNRSFEYYDRDNIADKHKMCWEPLIGTSFDICSESPINEVHTHYAAVKGGMGAGIRNTGYGNEGFAAKAGDEFIFSCYARTANNIRLAAVMADRAGHVIGRTDFECAGGGWQKYETEIKATEPEGHAFLSVILPEGGEAELEFISLFPKDTYKGRRNGMRRDIAELIADMKPKFLRFPGGCIVEGRSFDNMYNWKDTIGHVEMRRTNHNRWQYEEYKNLGFDASDYFQSYGIGFYEYFLFCEDIGSKPVPVINCGMTCQWHEALLVDKDKLDPFIQDALDLIEFANGATNTIWGHKRSEMGHPEPFGLEYIGIGNEQWGQEYFERYEIFEKVLSEKHPEIMLITSAGWKNRGWEYDLAYDWMKNNKDKAYAVDEHFYKEPEWFLNNTGRYDGYDRSLPKVFIGEWAAHTGAVGGGIRANRNDLYAALCEAAFLTGVEKNADHVIMSCYAPLLARIDHQEWQPDLIWFDNKSAYGTPSYYVQKLFSEHTGEYCVETECDAKDIYISTSVLKDKVFLKLINLSGRDREISISTDDLLSGEMKVIAIKGERNDENSVSEPQKVHPITKRVSGHKCVLKNDSFTVIELEVEQ